MEAQRQIDMKRMLAAAVLILAGCRSDGLKFSKPSGAGQGVQSWRKGCFLVDARIMHGSDSAERPGLDTAAKTLALQVKLMTDGTCPGMDGGKERDVVVEYAGSKEEADARIGHFDYGLRPNFWLNAPGGRLHPALYHMERTFGMEPGRVFLLQFRIDKDFKSKLNDKTPLELAFEIPVPGAGVALLTWPPHQLDGFL